jgi:hypothetical protein
MLSFWNWDSKNSECPACRNSLTDDSIHYSDRNVESTVVKGKCGHSMHYDCINQWLQLYDSCPLCNGEKWEYLLKTDVIVSDTNSTQLPTQVLVDEPVLDYLPDIIVEPVLGYSQLNQTDLNMDSVDTTILPLVNISMTTGQMNHPALPLTSVIFNTTDVHESLYENNTNYIEVEEDLVVEVD